MFECFLNLITFKENIEDKCIHFLQKPWFVNVDFATSCASSSIYIVLWLLIINHI